MKIPPQYLSKRKPKKRKASKRKSSKKSAKSAKLVGNKKVRSKSQNLNVNGRAKAQTGIVTMNNRGNPAFN